MRHRILALSIACALLGCGEDDADATMPPRGPFGAPAATTATAPQATEVAIARHHLDHDSLAHDVFHGTGGTPSASGTTGSTPSAPTDTTAEPEARNLQTELATALGSPATCIDVATARTLHGRLTLQVTVNVTPSGGVTRATAAGAGLPPAVLECVQSRALAVHLAAPIEGAPRAISTSLSFDVETTDDTTTRETPVWHQPGAVAEPGVVLPAVGAEGRPEGALTPDSVLPAGGTGGRPEGSVAPDLVLPARGQ